jgi:hypothetical protein
VGGLEQCGNFTLTALEGRGGGGGGGAVRSQSNELGRGPPELVQYFCL